MEWESRKTKVAVKAVMHVCMLVFMATFPYWSWLYSHRPHDGPQGLFTAKPIFGQAMYVLPWECSLLNGMVLGSWILAGITSLAWRGLYGSQEELVSRPLFGIAFVVTFAASLFLAHTF